MLVVLHNTVSKSPSPPPPTMPPPPPLHSLRRPLHLHRRQHPNPVLRRRMLHLLHLLTHPQILPIIHPITISVFKGIGANAGVLSGLLFTATTPWVVIAAGAAQCFFEYLMLWLAVVVVTFFKTGNVVVGVENFGEYGGTIVGIMKGFLGLSGAIQIQIYQALLKRNPSSFILMLASLPPSARYLMIVVMLENIFTFPLGARIATLIIHLILLSSPLKIALQARSEELRMGLPASPDEKDPLVHETEGETEKQKADNYGEYRKFLDNPDQQDTVTETEALAVDEGKNVLEAMRTLEFCFLFIAMACGMGSGLANINNMSQIAESLGYDTIQRNTLVSLWSIWNFLGRFGAGYVSDVLLHRNGWGRRAFMVITLASMAVRHIIIASGFPGNLYIATVLVGICYGSHWSLMPTITSEICGVLHMGTIFNTIAIASPVGSYFRSVQVAICTTKKQGKWIPARALTPSCYPSRSWHVCVRLGRGSP
ncbi:NUCLEAR FUSION DEFECTIVE 4-like protein [Drosera capensis]